MNVTLSLTNRQSCHFTGYRGIWRITQGFSNVWDKPRSRETKWLLFFLTPGGGQPAAHSALLLLYGNQWVESSSAKPHTPFHRSLKEHNTLSSYRVFRESSQHPALKRKKRAAKLGVATFVLWTQTPLHGTRVRWVLEARACPKLCVSVHMCRRFGVGAKVSAPLSWGYTLLSSSSGSLPSAPLPWGLCEWLCAPLLCFL